MITYKHATFVSQAIESVLAQTTSFPVELVVSDDASPDETIKEIERHLGNGKVEIRNIFNSTNLGMIRNFTQTIQACQGDYIALLEGDDYWTDPEKLQRQADFLDSDPSFSICFHPVSVSRGGKIEVDSLTRSVPEETDIQDLANGNFMHTCSVMFRARLFDEFPRSFFRSPVGDYFLHMLNAQYGRIKRLPQNMGVYRVHDGGVWSSQVGIDLKILDYLEAMIGCFSEEVNALLKQRHQRVAWKSFRNRVEEPEIEGRFARCTMFGTEVIAAELSKLFFWDKEVQGSRVLRLLRWLFERRRKN